MNGRTAVDADDTSPGYVADASKVEPLPTCTRGLAVAAITFVFVGLGATAAISAFRSPLGRFRPTSALAIDQAALSRPAASKMTVDAVDTSRARALLDEHVVELDAPRVTPRDATKGVLVLPPAAYGHRVYVEDRVVGSAAAAVAVACGRHRIKIGSHGRDRRIDVPCGGDVLVTYP
jgi:hypothetical protein